MWWEQPWWDPAIFPGMVGGAMLGLGRTLFTLTRTVGLDSPLPRYGRLFISQGVVTVMFAILGGVFAWAFSGKSGDFISGITALSLLAILAEKLMDRQDDPASPAGPSPTPTPEGVAASGRA